jgi:hypothetical protein
MKIILMALLGISLLTNVAFADVLVATDTMRLNNHAYVVGGNVIVCHWFSENPKLLGGKVNTGLSCVVIPPLAIEKPCLKPSLSDTENSKDSLF